MKKKIIATLLAVVMSMTLFVACGDTQTNYNDDGSNYTEYVDNCHHIMDKSTGTIITVDSCVYYAFLDVYEVTINGYVTYIPSNEIEFID